MGKIGTTMAVNLFHEHNIALLLSVEVRLHHLRQLKGKQNVTIS
jgi:hypothetical protein